MNSAELIEPTPEEARNGWTAATLTRYIRHIESNESAQYTVQYDSFNINPARAESRYNPLRW